MSELLSDWIDIIQLGRDGTNLANEIGKRIEEVSETNLFYNLPIHLASKILDKTGEITYSLAIKIIDKFTKRIGKDSIFLLNCLKVNFDKENNVISLLEHFPKSPILSQIALFKAETKSLEGEEYEFEEGAIFVDYEDKCHQLEIEVEELQMKLERKIKILSKTPKVEPKVITTLPKNIRTTVEECIKHNDPEALKYLLKKEPYRINEKIYYEGVEQTGYAISVLKGLSDLAVVFVQNGADPNQKIMAKRSYGYDDYYALNYAEGCFPKLAFALYKTGKLNKSAMEYAVISKRLDLVKELVEDDGANPTEGTFYANSTSPEIVDYLLANGADPNAVDPAKRPVIFNAGQNLGSFLEHGADPNAPDCNGCTPLFFTYEDKNAVEMLINAGADVNIKAKDGKTAIFNYMNPQNIEQAEMLLKHGADPNASYKGKTLLNFLIEKSQGREYYLSLIKLLIEYGAMPDRYTTIITDTFKQKTFLSVMKDLLEYAKSKGT